MFASTLNSAWSQISLRRYRAMADRVVCRSNELVRLGDDELMSLAKRVGWDARTGKPLPALLPDAFALVRETSRRVLGMAHYPVQIIGGISLFEEQIAEMQTGEGKTLTAALPVFLHALSGLGCHVVTTNDFLSRRDVEFLQPVYTRLGLTVGRVGSDSTPDQRRAAYGCDVTYGTAQELGFDFLRDRLHLPPDGLSTEEWGHRPQASSSTVQRGHHFVLIDEADSILLDEARTPLVIGLDEPNEPATAELFQWCRKAIWRLRHNEHYFFDPEHRRAELTNIGCQEVLLMSKPALLATVNTDRIYTHIELALAAELGFRRERDYVVIKDAVQIVDESTGRVMDGRKWQKGLHQSIEVKEGLPITSSTGEAARVTMQSFFRMYSKMAGMTGTGRQACDELKHSYGRRVTIIPTHRPCQRIGLPPRVFTTMEAKRRAVVDEIATRHANGQPILVGTPSVAASQGLGAMLELRKLPYQILNAYMHERESELISRAGQAGMITIATNMAGRGTDILIDDRAKQLGGLHVIATEMHSSSRIDRQLVGRAARQGDPGSYQFFLSLDDELLHCLPAAVVTRHRRRAGLQGDVELPARTWLPFFLKTQRFLETLHVRLRRDLLRREKQRSATHRQMGLDPCLELTEN